MRPPVGDHEGAPVFDEIIAISAHVDDAVFSAWSRLAQGRRVTLVTVCAGAPALGTPAARHDVVTGSTDSFRRGLERRAEERALAADHGWHAVALDFLDTPYRKEKHDLAAITDALVEVLRGREGEILLPAGIGLHPDHIAVRDAGLMALARLKRQRCWLFADLPYAARYGWAPWVHGAPRDPYLDIDAYYDISLSQIKGWRRSDPLVVNLSAEMSAEKLAAMRRYATQFSAIEAGPSRALSHPDRLPYEVFWELRRCD